MPVKLYECYLSMVTVYHNIYLFSYNVFLWADVMLLLCVCVIFCFCFLCVLFFMFDFYLFGVQSSMLLCEGGMCVCVCVWDCSLSLSQYLYMCT